MADEIRIGKVSTVDYANGMISVVYTDKDSAVTKPLPVLSFGGFFRMPAVGQSVLVAHLSNGGEAGIVLGSYWNKANTPPVGQGASRLEMGSSPGEAYIECSGGQITMHDGSATLTLADIQAGLGGGE